jgi:hypothetical protein
MSIFSKKDSKKPSSTVSDNGQETVQPDDQPASPSKMDKARVVFTKMFGNDGIKRKDIIERFIADCDLTKAGASTYYAKLKKESEKGV